MQPRSSTHLPSTTIEPPNRALPTLGFCAAGSGAGKTTLLVALIPALQRRGLRVSVVKHAHHEFDIDQPGKDSHRLRTAGAVQMLIGSSRRWALMTELGHIPGGRPEPELAELLTELDPTLADLVIVEGFKTAAVPKIEVHRPALGLPLLAGEDANIIAVASDVPIFSPLPVLDLNDSEKIADFVVGWLNAKIGAVAADDEPV